MMIYLILTFLLIMDLAISFLMVRFYKKEDLYNSAKEVKRFKNIILILAIVMSITGTFTYSALVISLGGSSI